MKRIYTTVVYSLALAFAFVGVITAQQQDSQSQSQDRTIQERGGIRTDDRPNAAAINQLWQQIAQLHKQIVALELSQSSTATTPRPDPFSGDAPDAEVRRLNNAQDRPARADERSSVAGTDADPLWKQVAQVHRRLVAMEATKDSPRADGTTPPGRTGRVDRDPVTGTPDRANDLGRDDQTIDRIAGTARDLNPLLQQYARLQIQIIRQDVDAATKTPTPTVPSRGTSNDEPNPERPTRE